MIVQYPRVFVFYIFFGAAQNAVIEDSQQSNSNVLLSNSPAASHNLEINSITPLQGKNDSLNIKSSIDFLLKKMNRKISKKVMNNIQNNYYDLLKKSKYINDKKKLKRIKKLKADDDNDENKNRRVVNADGAIDETLTEYAPDLNRKRSPLTTEEDSYEAGSSKNTKATHRVENPKHKKKAKSFYAPDSITDLDADKETNIDKRKNQECSKRNNDFDIEADSSDYEDVMKKSSMQFKSMKTEYDEGDLGPKFIMPFRNKVSFIESDIESTTLSDFASTEGKIIKSYPKKPWYIMKSESNKNPVSLVDTTLVSKKTTDDAFAEKTSDELYRVYDHSPNEAVVSSTTRKFKDHKPLIKALINQVVNIEDVTNINEELVTTIETESKITPVLVNSVKHNDDNDVDDITDRSLDPPETNKFHNHGIETTSEAWKEETVTRSFQPEYKENIFYYKATTRQQHTGRNHSPNKHNNLQHHKQPFNFDPFSKKAHRMKYILDKVTPDITFEIVDTTDAEDVAYTATRAMLLGYQHSNMKTTKKYKNRIQDDNKHQIESSLMKNSSNLDKKKMNNNTIISKTIRPATALGTMTSLAKSKKLNSLTKVLNDEKTIPTHLSSIVSQSKSTKIEKAMEKTVVNNVLEKYNIQQTTMSTIVDIDAKMYEKVIGITPLKSTTISELTVLNYTPQFVKNNYTEVVNYKKDNLFTSIAPTYTTIDIKSSTVINLTEDKYIALPAKVKSTTHKILPLKLPKKVISTSITPLYKNNFIETTTKCRLNVTLPVNFKLFDIKKFVNRSTYLPWYNKKHSKASSAYRYNSTTIALKGKNQTERNSVTTSKEKIVHKKLVTQRVETRPIKTVLKAEGENNDDYDSEEDVFENEPIYTPDLFTSISNEINTNISIPVTVKVKNNNISLSSVTMKPPIKRYKTKSMTENLLHALIKLNPISQSEVTPSSLGQTNYTNSIFSVYKKLIQITLEVLLDKSQTNNNRTWYTIVVEEKTPVNNDTSVDENEEDITDLIFSESFLKGVFSQGNMYAADNVTTTTKYSYLNSNLGENSDDQTNSDRDDSNTFENEPVFTDQEMNEYNSNAKSFVETILQFIINKSVNKTSNKTSFLKENSFKSVSPAYKNIVNTVLKIFNNKTKNRAFYGNKTISMTNMSLIRNNNKYPTQGTKDHKNISSLNGTMFREVVPLTGNTARTAVIEVNSNNTSITTEHIMKEIIAPDKHKTLIIDKQSTETAYNKQADFYESTTNTTEIIQIVTVSNIDFINLQSSKANFHKHKVTGTKSSSNKPYENSSTVTSQNSVLTKYTSAPTTVKGTNKPSIIDDHKKRTDQSNNVVHDKTDSASIALNAEHSKVKPKEFVNIFTQPIEQIYEEFGKKSIDYADYEEVTSSTKLEILKNDKSNKVKNSNVMHIHTTIKYKDYGNDINNTKNNLFDMKANGKIKNLWLPYTEKNNDKIRATMQTTTLSKVVSTSYVKENPANNITVSEIPINKKVTSFYHTRPNESTSIKSVSNQTVSSALLHKNTSSLLSSATVAATVATTATTTAATTTAATTTAATTTTTVHESTNLNVLSTAAAKKLSTQNMTKWIRDEWIFEENGNKLPTDNKSKIFPKTALGEISNINMSHRTDNLQILENAVLENRASLMDIINDLDKLNAALVLYNKELTTTSTTVVPNAKGVTPHETTRPTLTDIKPEELEEMLFYEMPVKIKEIDSIISSTPKIIINETFILSQDTLNEVIKELELMNDIAEGHKYTDSDVTVNKTGSYPAKVNPHDPNLGDVLRKVILEPKTPELTSKKSEKVSILESGGDELHPKSISIHNKNLETVLQTILLHYTLAKPEKTTEMSTIVTSSQQNMTSHVPVKVYNWKNIVNSVLGNTRKNQEQTCPTVHCFVINSADNSKPRIKVSKLPEDEETLYPKTSRLNDTKLNKKYNDRKNFPNAKLNGDENEGKLLPANQITNVVDKNEIAKLNETLLSALKPIKTFFYKKPSVETFVPDTNKILKPAQDQLTRPVAPSYVSPDNTCGLNNAASRTVKEGEDDIETYPWLGVLMYPKGKKRLVTTVILVTVQLVIASAWEINKLPKEDFRYCAKVILGQNCTGPRMGVISYNYHPDFRVGFYSALAVIQIDTSNVIGKLQPICPPPQLIVQPQYYSIVMPEDCTSSKVNLFKMDSVPIESCKQYYKRTRLDTSRFWPRHSMCGKARRGGICRWRAGTALVAKQDNRWHLLGFSVSGPGCEAPARFLDYGMHTRWVELTVDRIGQPAITRIAPNKIVFRRSLNQIQRFGPCDREELFTTIFRDSTDVQKPPGTKRETSRIYYNLTILKDMDYQCLVFQADNVGEQWLPLPKLEIRKNRVRATPIGGNSSTVDFNITIEYYDDIQYKVQAYGLKLYGSNPKSSKHENLLIPENHNMKRAKLNDDVTPDETENDYHKGAGKRMQFWNERTIYYSDEEPKNIENDKLLKSFWDDKTKYSDDDAKNNDNEENAKYIEKDNEIKPVWEINGRRYIRRKSLEKYKNSYTHNFHGKTAIRSRRKTVENSNRRLAKERGRRRQKKRSNNMDSKSTKHKTRTRQR